MRLSEVSIRRPVLATVMALVLVLLGMISFTHLPIREYPDIDPSIVSVSTEYPGASARLVETDVTRVLEESLSGIESLKTLSSVSREELSQITVEFDLARDLDAAANDVRDRVFSVRRWLPINTQEPIISKASADAYAMIWLSLTSDRHTELEITDFAERSLKDRLAALPGVSAVWIWGARRYAMRIWIDADRLGSRGLTAQDVEEALQHQNVAIPSGRIESKQLEFTVRTLGELQTEEQFNQLIIAYRNGYPIRLQEVGHAEVSAADDRRLVRLDGKPTVSLGIVKKSKANALALARAVRKEFEEMQAILPEGMTFTIASDQSLHIERSLHEVYATMAISVSLVVLVIYLFLGDLRATAIPTVVIPGSIISTFTLMHLFGFSINMLTLLGLVLAIGLVVDDAIVMLENIYRRIERGEPPLHAAFEGSREIGFAVMATTLSLVAVFVPIAFLTDATARLFAELGLAVAGSVLISGFIALTLTPMMSAKMLRRARPISSAQVSRFSRLIRRLSDRLIDGYRSVLTAALQARSLVAFFATAALIVGIWLFITLPSELAPLADVGGFGVKMRAPEGATIRHTDHYAREIEALYGQVPEIASYLTWVASGWPVTNVSRAGGWVTLKDWGQRKRSQQQIVAELERKMAMIPGVIAFPYNPAPIGGGGGKSPVQLVIGGSSYEELEKSLAIVMEGAKVYPGLTNVASDLELGKPELDVHVDRDKAADLGVSLSDIGHTLQTMLGGRLVTGFTRGGKEYPVIVKINDQDRMNPSDITALYVRGHQGELVQLTNLVTVQETVGPTELNHYAKMRSAILTAGVAPGYTLGQALDYLERMAHEKLPLNTPISYAGESKTFKEASRTLEVTFLLGFLFIYLVLAAQFESFVHPFTILLSVPPAVTGALLAIACLGGTLNIYSEIGIIMLIGLVSKNAILIVDFANQLRAQGAALMPAIVEASARRLRPILMTTLATILGALPLTIAAGTGATGRQQIGHVIIAGMIFSTLFTLLIVPVVYCHLSWRPGRYGITGGNGHDESHAEPAIAVPAGERF